ncbi:putative oxidoreductase [Xylariales sp. AK1849]|nr:putative oxidoreductase [Xylariales sp. AK1849]
MAPMADTIPEASTARSFTSIPVIDLSLAADPSTKGLLLSELRNALVVVGFFYLVNTSIPRDIREAFVEKSTELCNLPLEKKLEIDMINSKHFLGYSRMGLEKTARKTDNREMFDFLSPLPPPGPEDPVWLNVQGPNQWPDERAVPGFRIALENYLSAVGDLGDRMKTLVAEALDLPSDALDGLFSYPPRNKVSLLKYPPPAHQARTSCLSDKCCDRKDDSSQGVGPHKDGGFLTYLLQATSHPGLEAQNKSGQWIPVPPLPDSLVVNVGRSLESITGGVCTATTHRVQVKPDYFFDEAHRPRGPRFSFPVFQTLKLDLSRQELQSLKLPRDISELVKDEKVRSDAEAFFAKYHLETPGIGIFTARLTSHPAVGQRWYPKLLEQALRGQKEFTA